MGSSIGIRCSECDYAKNFRVGVGMMYNSENLADFESEDALIPDLIPSKETVETIRELLEEKNGEISEDYRHEVYHCPGCGEFFERFFLHIDHDRGSFEIKYPCPRCDTDLEPVEYVFVMEDGWEVKKIDLGQYPCPRCGKDSLYEDGGEMILWD